MLKSIIKHSFKSHKDNHSRTSIKMTEDENLVSYLLLLRFGPSFDNSQYDQNRSLYSNLLSELYLLDHLFNLLICWIVNYIIAKNHLVCKLMNLLACILLFNMLLNQSLSSSFILHSLILIFRHVAFNHYASQGIHIPQY